jgi:hypothetical protein
MIAARSDRSLANGASGVNPLEREFAESAIQREVDRFFLSSALWGAPRGGKNPKSRRQASAATPAAPKANEKEKRSARKPTSGGTTPAPMSDARIKTIETATLRTGRGNTEESRENPAG